MFERYTVKARRAIFFARYEASQFGSRFITMEHVLLGLLREDKSLANHLGPQRVQALRAYVVQHSPPSEESFSTSVDLPLDRSCQDVLQQAAEEADALSHKMIDSSHLILALLRKEESVAAQALRAFGIDYQSYRVIVAAVPHPKPGLPEVGFDLRSRHAPSKGLPIEVAAPALHDACNSLASLVDTAAPELEAYSEADGFRMLGRGNWMRKVALGHLIDWACAHQQWFARALAEPRIAALSYPDVEWAAAQKYSAVDWSELTILWLSLNRLLVHVISQVPESRLATPCRVGLDEAIPLHRLIENYVDYCLDEMAEILTRG